MKERKRIFIQGIVQGVGFRPFVYNLARRFDLTGWVLNNSLGVTIEAEGNSDLLESFLFQLQSNPPVLAQITGIRIEEIPVNHDAGFAIKASRKEKDKFTLISPDISICDDCLNELFTPGDRRFRYPFINCTNCGPRYTIIKDIPYDRPKTTMAEFPMCEACRAEYENPENRRFHAQPNACPVCGPKVWLTDGSGNIIEGDPIAGAIRLLKEGKIVAIKGLGGFHLAADAVSETAVQLLRSRKHRYEKPLALMSESVEIIKTYARVEDKERIILESPQRPICLLKKKTSTGIAPSVSPDNDYLGVMLPYTPLHYLLLREGGFTALVMTSGNLSEEPIVYRNEEALQRLEGIADYYLLNDRDIWQRADDSVVRLLDAKLSYIRRSRGFVPSPVIAGEELPAVLAVGGELKNTLCLTKKRFLFLSQHIGDLENLETLEFFEKSAAHLQKILEIKPAAIACDMHPDYLSTRWALQQQEVPLISVQHHHAHIGSVMAEKGLTGKVIGFSLDGTGYGTDGTIWGGEILMADELEFTRLAHFRLVPLPGGEKAIREPWRMALAYCRASGFEIDHSYFSGVSKEEFELVSAMLEKKLNSPLTSSCGRLFDAAAALNGLRGRVGYEGQAAMQLEALAEESASESNEFYEFDIKQKDGGYVLDWRPLIRNLLGDIKNALPQCEVSRKFHLGLVESFAGLAKILRDSTRLNRIALSGGCFQNRFLTENLIKRLKQAEFEVFYHTVVPSNDGGLALGQAYIAAHRLKYGKIS